MRPFLIKQIKSHIRPRARNQVMRCTLDEVVFERSQYLQGERRDGADMAAAAAIWALFGRAFQHTRTDALPRHFKKAEMRDAADLNARAIVFKALLQSPLHRAIVALLIHVDEVDDDQSGKISQAQLSRDFVGCL